MHLALHKGLKIGNYLITSTTKVANLKLLTRENKGDHLEGHQLRKNIPKWNRQFEDERPSSLGYCECGSQNSKENKS